MAQKSIFVPVGYALTLTAPADSAGSYWLIGSPGDEPSGLASLAASASVTLGPFDAVKEYMLQCDNGSLTATLALNVIGTDSSNTSAITAETARAEAAESLLAPKASPIFTTDPISTTVNLGTANTGTTAAEYGDGIQHTTVLAVNTTLPAITGGAAQGVGKLLYTLPAGAEVIDVSYMNIAITQSEGNINADTPAVGLGSVIATGAISDFTGHATFDDLITGQTAADCNGTATVKTIADQIFVSEAAGSKAINFNAANTWAASGDSAAAISGTVVLHWKFIH